MNRLSYIAAFALASMISAGAAEREFGPLTLHYDKPATRFEEALVLGNGNLGATIYGGTVSNRISLNDITLWTGENEKGSFNKDAWTNLPAVREALFREDYRAADTLNRRLQGHYSQRYQPLGTLTIEYEGHNEATNYKRWLDLSEATMHESFSVNGATVSTDYFVSAPDSVIVICLKSEAPLNAVLRLGCELPHKFSAAPKEIASEGYAAYHSYPPNHVPAGDEPIYYDPNRGIHFRTILRVASADGQVTPSANGSISLVGCHDVVVIVSNVTSFNGSDKDPVKEGKDYSTLVRARIDAAAAKTSNELLSAHKSDYKELFDRVKLDLGKTPDEIAALPTDEQLKRYGVAGDFNPELEVLYFQFGRYLLISSSRTDGIPANLQGLWNESVTPPWNSNYTVNINLEENYWPASVAGLGELEDVLFSFLKNVSKNGVTTAKEFYGIERGWTLAHNTDVWAMSTPVGLGSGDPRWANWNMGGAWLATHIWENYTFSKDIEKLKDNWPTLKGAAEFCLDWLVNKDGELITAPSSSPEAAYVTPDGYKGATLYGGTADLAIIRECLTDAMLASKALHTDRKFRRETRRTLRKLRPYHIGAEGNLQEWYHDWKDQDPQHRHQSHLIGLYPGHQITPQTTPELANAAAKSLEIKGDKTTGWSTGWRINLWARLRNPKQAYHIFRKLLTYFDPYRPSATMGGGGTYPNFLDAHPPFQIDGNFGGSAGVLEMLVQSSEKEVELLPAIPEEWSEGSLTGVRARGGLSIDMAWSGGKVTSLKVSNLSSHKTKTNLLFNGSSSKLRIRSGESVQIL